MIVDLIKQRKFTAFLNSLKELNIEDFIEDIQESAYLEEDVVYYDFLFFLIQNGHDTAQLHYYASEMMAAILNFLPNAYKIAFEHALNAIELEPNDISLKEYVLLFYEIPDQLLTKEAAMIYAQDILKEKPSNPTALNICLSKQSQNINTKV